MQTDRNTKGTGIERLLFKDLDEVRKFMFDAIASFRLNKARGIIAEFYH